MGAIAQTLQAQEYQRVSRWSDWQLKQAKKALSTGVASFLNTPEDNARLEAIKQVQRERKH